MTASSATALPPAITAIGLRKSCGDEVVLDGIGLRIPEGTVFALLWPNGSGKTTTVQILSTYPDGRDLGSPGHRDRRLRRHDRGCGPSMPEEPGADEVDAGELLPFSTPGVPG